MQVVYSGGSTPTPSPRVQRKQYAHGYGRPVLPGYVAGSHHTVPHCRSPGKDKTEDTESSLRDSIPAMTKPLAVTCLVMNILIPGLGTFVSGLSVLCCSKIRLKDQSKQKVVTINTWVALLQFLTAFIFLLGWIWSIVWGTSFLSYSEDYYKVLKDEDKKKEQKEQKEQNQSKDTQNGRSPLRQRSENIRNDHHTNVNTSLMYQTITIPRHSRSTSNLPSSSSDSQIQPIIVLQELPVLNQTESTLPPSLPILNARTRHQKILRRQMSDNELSPFSLTQEQLEEIVIHAAPIHRGRLQRDESVASNHSDPGLNSHNNTEKNSRTNN